MSKETKRSGSRVAGPCPGCGLRDRKLTRMVRYRGVIPMRVCATCAKSMTSSGLATTCTKVGTQA